MMDEDNVRTNVAVGGGSLEIVCVSVGVTDRDEDDVRIAVSVASERDGVSEVEADNEPEFVGVGSRDAVDVSENEAEFDIESDACVGDSITEIVSENERDVEGERVGDCVGDKECDLVDEAVKDALTESVVVPLEVNDTLLDHD